MPGDRGGEDDLSDGMRFDERFISSAAFHEDSAEERLARLGEVDAEHRRRWAERASRADDLWADDRWGGGGWPDEDLPRRPGLWRRLVRSRALAVVVILMVTLASWRWFEVASSRRAEPASAPVAGAEGARDRSVDLVDWPPPSPEVAEAPLGQPPAVPEEEGPYAFVRVDGDGRPVTFDPCRPIHVVLNERTAPPGASALVSEALGMVGAATGLRFEVDGHTTEAPSAQRSPYQPDRYPDRWAPVLVAWSDPQEAPGLAGDVVGLGGGTAVDRDGEGWAYVTGGVTLDGPHLQEVLQDPAERASARAVIAHEVAHLVGLDHVDDPTQLMNPHEVPGVTAFGAGDLHGLAELGRGECRPDL